MRSVNRSPAGLNIVSNCTSLLLIVGGLLASFSASAAPPEEDVMCILGRPNAPNGLNCTANDTTLSSPTITVIKPCNFPGDIATLNVTVDITIGAQTRYDLSVWLATDGDPNGDGAESGQCAVLSVDNNLIHVDQVTSTLGDTDQCGDVFNVDPAPPVPPTETAHLLNADLGTVSLLCEDTDGDGKIDVPIIVAWEQQSNDNCAVSSDAVPGTASKCVQDNSFALDIPIPGVITVDKVTVPADGTDFLFNLSGPPSPVLPEDGGFSGSEDFSLNDASPIFNTGQFTGGVLAGIYSVTETANPLYITDVSCTGSEGAEDPVAIDVSPGEVVNCVFTNTLNSATINVVKNTVGGNGQFTINWTGPTTSGGVALDTGEINTDSDTIITTETGTFTLTELIPTNWVLGNAACVDDNDASSVGTWDTVDTINGIDLAPGDSVTCTFTNQAVGSVMLVKNTVGGDGSFDFVTDVPGLGTNIQTTAGTGNATPASNVPTGTYSIVETVPAGWVLDTATCDNGSPPDALVLTTGDTVTCTFVDIKLGTVIVEKQTLPDGDPQQFDFTGNITGTIGDGGQIVVPGLLPATYTSTETVPADWDLTSIVCDDDNSTGDTEAGTATFNLEAGEIVTCVFTNTKDGSIEVVKALSDTGPLNETFGFTSNFNGAFNLVGDAATTGPIAVAPGSGYTVSEDDPTANGWANTGASCGDGSDPLTDIVVSPGEVVVCTFTNTPLGSAVVIKDTVGGNGIFGFTGDAPIGPFSLDTTDQFTATTGDLFDYILSAGIYDVTEDNIPAGWELSSIGCDNGSLTDVGTATASMDVELAETVTCIFTNTADGTLIIRKETLPDGAEQGFEFTGDAAGTIHDYSTTAEEIVVSGQPGIYTSAELPVEGWVISDISCTGQVQSGVTYGDADVSVDLAAGETVICTFENTVQGSITIEKFTQGGVGAFQFNGDFGSFQLNTADANPDSDSFTNLLPGTYMVSEVVPSNWTLSDIQCSGAESSTITIGGEGDFDPGDQGVTIELADGESIICTFINDADGSITVTKVTDPTGSAQSFDFTGDITASLTDGQSSTTVMVPAGNYSVSETDVPGWDLTDISCNDDDSAGTGNTANFVVGSGEGVICTFTNTQRGTITLVKNLPNDNGGDAVETDFTAFIDGNPVPWSVAQELVPGDYTASETTLTGYEPSGWFNACAPDGVVTLGAGENLVCEITNDDIAPTLTLVKTVSNDNGGLLTQSDFPSFVNGAPQAWDVATAVQANALLTATETPQTGYTPSAWGGDCAPDGTITLAPGDTKVCSITNDDVAPTLTLIKTVSNDNGGLLTQSDFPSFVNGTPQAWDVATAVQANALLTATETPQTGYTPSAWGGDCAPDGTITLLPGDTKVCSITNDDVAPTLTLVKTVINDNGGDLAQSDFPSFVNDVPQAWDVTTVFQANVPLLASETPQDGYTPSAWGGDCAPDGSITLLPGDEKVCSITNDDAGATLTLVKTVINDNGGLLTQSDFPSFINGSPQPWGVAATVTTNEQHTVSETPQTGYTPSVWGGDCAADGTVTLLPGEAKTCTITNDDVAPTLTLVKTVTNDNGGDLTQSDFPSFVNGAPQAWDVATELEANLPLTASETPQTGYSPSVWGGDCAEDGTIVLLPGDEKTCTITNDDIAPMLTLIKVPTNDNFGTALPDDFLPTVGGVVVVSGQSNPYEANVPYAIDETLVDGYSFVSITGNDECPEALGGTVTLAPGDNITCTITNDDDPPAVNLVKTAADPIREDGSGNYAVGTYTVVYTITANNGGSGSGEYDLVDTFEPAVGLVLNSAELTSYNAGTEDSQTGTVSGVMPYTFANGEAIVTGEELAAGLNESWTITANFTVVQDDLDGSETDCVRNAPESGKGFYNSVNGNIEEDESDNIACVNLPQINLAKTASGPTIEDGSGDYAAGTYTVVYTVTATNSGDVSSTYDLVDTLDPADGLSLNSVELTNYTPGTENSQTGTLSGTMPFEFASGDTIVTGEDLAIGLDESWTITANFTIIQEELTEDASICTEDDPQAGEGFYNLVQGNIVEDESDNRACVKLFDPQINLAKSSLPAENVGVNTWEVVYTITATNAGEGPGVYDIIDTLMPGDGITPVIDATYPAIAYVGGEVQTGVIAASPLTNGGTWVTLEGLGPQASETWTVTARFTVDEQVLMASPTNADCVLDDGEQGTGYFNYVEGSETDEDLSDNETCVPHMLPSTPVPTLSTWAMLLMILLMTGLAGWYFRPVQTRRIS